MYNHQEIEKKWQQIWEEKECNKADNKSDKKKYYILVEFPYPSGQGLHVGHVRSYTALDAYARMMRMKGYNVLFPIGWDAFGAPAEQYAIKNHIHPKMAVLENIKTFKSQIKSLGISFDWSREIATTDPEYYKWTQWQFLQFYKHGMAYKELKSINWCPNCKTGLSNEDSSGGVCERCGTKVIQKEKEQWMLKMSDYAEDLLKGLDDTHFAEKVKLGQINWIGKSEGAEINFKVDGTNELVTVYTTRCDTIFGATFMVIAPEHPLVDKIKDKVLNIDEIKAYQLKAKEKTVFERTELVKEKTGVKLDGIYAINPLNNKNMPIWISDYVMMNYGTGAIMAVPAHDERDYEFAKKYDMEIIPVLEGGDVSKEAYLGDGKHINSSFIDGLDKEEAIEKILEFLNQNNLGRKKVNYRLQDWIFSRQRFWGEPIPLVYCEKCGWVPVPDKDLPVLLPDVVEYEPTDDGESPLAKIDGFVNTTCPKCGGPAKRETDTMPNWAGSSWYYLRYMDPNNKYEFVSKQALNYWGKVDWYNGGMEHTTRHLLYARFWNQFLYNNSLVANKEPFDIRVSHGMILGANGEKMSKSKGNVINPDDIVKEYSADALRIYEMFIGDYEKDASWSMESLNGCKRFLNRVYRLQEHLNDKEGYSDEVLINKSIKKVTNDLCTMKYNTAISTLMIMLNELESKDSITKEDYKVLLILLNPFAPHLTEELNEQVYGNNMLCSSIWPTYDEDKTKEDKVEIGVQINGKLRASLIIERDLNEDEIKKQALELDNIKKYTYNQEILKIIVIKNKIVNIVVKSI